MEAQVDQVSVDELPGLPNTLGLSSFSFASICVLSCFFVSGEDDQDLSIVEQRILLDVERDEAERVDREVNDHKSDDDLSQLRGVLERTIEQLDTACDNDYTIIGDNIDLLVKVIGTSKNKRNKFYHWFHLIGVFYV